MQAAYEKPTQNPEDKDIAFLVKGTAALKP